jgi:hypothetical protein
MTQPSRARRASPTRRTNGEPGHLLRRHRLGPRGRFGWARAEADEAGVETHRGGTEIFELVASTADDLAADRPVALGFECPLVVPVPDDPMRLGMARPGESNRSWSAGAGAGALATGIVEVAWVLVSVCSRARSPRRGREDNRAHAACKCALPRCRARCMNVAAAPTRASIRKTSSAHPRRVLAQPPPRGRDAPPHPTPSRSSFGWSDRARRSRSSAARVGRAAG